MLTMLSVFVLFIGTIAFAIDDISGEYIFRNKIHKSFVGAVTIKSSGSNAYDVKAYTQDTARASFFANFKGKVKLLTEY